MRGIRILAGVILLMGVPFATVAADSPPFFQGKTIRLYIGTEAGGGHDLYPRLAARHMGKYLAGAPNFVPVNVTRCSARTSYSR